MAIAEAVGFALLRGAVLALLFLGAARRYRRLRGRDGIGLGDVKLAGVAGAWLGWLDDADRGRDRGARGDRGVLRAPLRGGPAARSGAEVSVRAVSRAEHLDRLAARATLLVSQA